MLFNKPQLHAMENAIITIKNPIITRLDLIRHSSCSSVNQPLLH
jgi:hypothetical protein